MTDKRAKILIISSDKRLREVLVFCFDGWGYKTILHESVDRDVRAIKKISPDVIVVDVHSATNEHLEICRLIKDDFLTAFIPVITLIDKRQLRSQLLNLKQGVDDYLIKPPDPLDLRVRVEMVIRRAQHSFYASPLTGLPGGRIIEEVLKDRIKQGRTFSFGYLDIDNFKYFNDTYGYLKGDRAIMQTAYMLYTAISRFGNRDDFIGHIGGDDFVFITTMDKYRAICHGLMLMFNRLMPFHYTREDRARGYIVARDRTHKIKNIPMMTISLAVVNKGEPPTFKNVIEINESVAEVKRYLKNFEGSKFMEDRRRGRANEEKAAPNVYRHNEGAQSSYRPLGQILLADGLISAVKLDEALSIHWRRGVKLGEVLVELGFVPEAVIKEVLDGSDKDGEYGGLFREAALVS